MDNQEAKPGEQKKDQVKWTPVGRPDPDGMQLVDLSIGKDEPIIHGLLRGSVETWRRKHRTQKLAVVLFALASGGIMYYYYGLLVAVFLSIAILIVIPYEMYDAFREERKNIEKDRIYRPRGILKKADVKFSRLRRKVETFVYDPDPDGTKPKYEEYFHSKDLNDPKEPNMIRKVDVMVIETGIGTYNFGIDIKPADGIIIGDKGNSIPVFDLLPYMEETRTFVSETMAKAKKELDKGALKFDDYSEMHEKSENALMAFSIFEAFARSRNIKMKKLGDLNANDKKFVVAMDRQASKFFESLKQYTDLEKMTPAVREAKFISIVNAETVQQERIGFWQMHEKELGELMFAEAIDTEYAMSSRAPEESNAFWSDYHKALDVTRTKQEQEAEQRGTEES